VTLKDTIIRDIYENHRSFLSGQSSTPDEVARHMNGAIKMDNIKDEERLLLLSTLPRHAEQVWIAQLDKGLSGSSVFSVRYSDVAGRLSKPFVAKIGELGKIDLEVEATSRYAAPYLPGIENPVCRRGEQLGLIGQELRGLSAPRQTGKSPELPAALRARTGHGRAPAGRTTGPLVLQVRRSRV